MSTTHPATWLADVDPPAYLANVPDRYMRGNRRHQLAAWLAERHQRPTLAQIEAERARRRQEDRNA